jgi:papain fold toxin 1 (glutamine deamidase) of polymorphic toxin system
VATAVVSAGASLAEIPVFLAAARLACRQFVKRAVRLVQTELRALLHLAERRLKWVSVPHPGEPDLNLVLAGSVPRRRGRPRTRRLWAPRPDRIEELFFQSAVDNPNGVFARTRHYANTTLEEFQLKYPDLGHRINPQYHRHKGYGHNCTTCVAAVDSSLAGNPISAVPVFMKDAKGMPFDDPRRPIITVFDDLKGDFPFRRVSGYTDIADELEAAAAAGVDQPRGVVTIGRYNARGEVASAHMFNVVKRDTVDFIDGVVDDYAYLQIADFYYFMRTK